MPEVGAVALFRTAEPAAFAHGVAGNTGGTDMRLANAQSVSYLCAEAMRVIHSDGRRPEFDGDGGGLPV